MLAAEPRRRFSVIGDWERVPRVSVQLPVTVAQRGGHRSGTALSDWLTVERCDWHHTAGGASEEDLLRAAKRARGYVTDPRRPSEVVGDLDLGPSSDPLQHAADGASSSPSTIANTLKPACASRQK